jgi:hypothetical protein
VGGVDLERRHLAQRVDAGVSAAGAFDPYFLLEELLEDFFNGLLDGNGSALALPAGIPRAVVLKGYADCAM